MMKMTARTLIETGAKKYTPVYEIQVTMFGCETGCILGWEPAFQDELLPWEQEIYDRVLCSADAGQWVFWGRDNMLFRCREITAK